MQTQTQLNKYLETGLIAIFQAENQINEAVEHMIKEVASSDLKEALERHQKETDEQINRLQKIAEMMSIDLEKSRIAEKEGIIEKSKELAKGLLSMDMKASNKIIQGLISQGKEILGYLAEDKEGKDLGIAAGAQLIEEFEVISYRALRALAKKSENEEIAKLLEATLQEEQKAWEAMKNYLDQNMEKIES